MGSRAFGLMAVALTAFSWGWFYRGVDLNAYACTTMALMCIGFMSILKALGK